MRKYFVISGFAAVMIAACSVARAGTGEGSTSRGGGTSFSGKVPTFTLDQAVLTALQRNPTLLNAEQEIKRTKGVIIQVRAQALPNIASAAEFQWTDPKLGTSGGGIVGGASAAQDLRSDLFYTIRVTGTQLIFNGTTFNQIR